eukprot:m.162878 g.162878  ORF g.162878 m.162878 type:complete len:96 (+) comp10306_c0_seq1:35-322(+)
MGSRLTPAVCLPIRFSLVPACVCAPDEDNNARFVTMVSEGDVYSTDIPSVFILGVDGAHLIDAIEDSGRLSAEISIPINESSIAPHEITPWTIWQ